MTRVLYLFHSEHDARKAAFYEDEWIRWCTKQDVQFRGMLSLQVVTDPIDLLIAEDKITKAVDVAEDGFASGKINTIAHCFSVETLLSLPEHLPAPAVITLDFDLSPDSGEIPVLSDASLQRTTQAFDSFRSRWRSSVIIGLTQFIQHRGAKPLIAAIERLGSITYEYTLDLKRIFPKLLADAVDRHHERVAAEASRSATEQLLESGRSPTRIALPRRVRERVPRTGRGGEQLATVLHQIDRLAPTAIPVIFEGESGVGKTWYAERLHNQSGRKGTFLRVNCAELEPDKAVARLFGYERGAFTGADRRTDGLIQATEHGTLFLDDISDLKLDVQSKLLRFLDDGRYFREGGNDLLRSDARVIAASNIDLDDAARRGVFRQDILNRISPARLRIPPLRDRLDELPQLIDSMFGGATPGLLLTDEAWDALYGYQWPGNVRELEKTIEYALAFAKGAPISHEHLPPQIMMAANLGIVHLSSVVSNAAGPKPGDAMWHAYLAGTPFFACSFYDGHVVLSLMDADGGTYEVRAKRGSRKPSPFKEWISRIEDKELARACIARAITQAGDLTGPNGALVSIGRYLDDSHRDTVRVQITRGYRMFKGIQPTAVRRGEYDGLLHRYFSS